MNYGKKGLRSGRKKLSSHGDKLEHAFSINVLRILLFSLIFLLICTISLGIGVFKGILASTPDVSEANIIPVGYATYMYDSEGNMIQKLTGSNANRVAVSINDIPLNMQHAIVAIEDERFYEHNGIDFKGILRAGVNGIGRILTGHSPNEGASTLTQQLLKNNVFTTWTQENELERIRRKVQEQSLALQLEANLTKEGKDTKSVILENYLNTINMGAGTYGVQTASYKYFGKSVSELTLSECAVLAAIPQNPTSFNPINNPEKNAERRTKVLNNMLQQGYISENDYQKALLDPVYDRIAMAQEKQENKTNVYSYFVDAAINQVLEDLQTQKGYTETQASNALYSGGLRIYTTQDPAIQKIVDEEYSDPDNFPAHSKIGLNWALTITKADGEQQNYSKEMLRLYFRDTEDKNFELLFDSEEEAQSYVDKYKAHILAEEAGSEILAERISFTLEPQSSMTIMDQKTGYVKAIIGGRGEKTASLTLNRATDSTRQPGSTFKIVSTYATALEEGQTLATVYKDEKYEYENGTQVRNASGRYLGNITIRKAIEQSVNVVAVKTLTEVTPQAGYEQLLKFGFTTLADNEVINGKVFTDIRQPLALGGITHGVTNLELTAAYASLANGGIYHAPSFYTTVTDSDGNILLESQPDTHETVKDSTAYLLTSAMEDVVTKGTGTALKLGDMPVAGKTGTTSDYNDVWFAGYTPYYTATVWAGYDGNQKLAKSGTYRTYHKTLWQTIMKRIHEDLPAIDFQIPSSVEKATICTKTGLLASSHCKSITEYFARSTVPDEHCTECEAAWKAEQERLKKEAEEKAAQEAAEKAAQEAEAAQNAGGQTPDNPAASGTGQGNAPANTTTPQSPAQ